LFHRIALARGVEPERTRCEYLGLNHLGWVRRVYLDGQDVTDRLLSDPGKLTQLYPEGLFEPDMLRTLQLIPTEYLFFYYCRRKALDNQRMLSTTRGEEVARLNEQLMSALSAEIASGDLNNALAVYTAYINQRSNSYMKLEATGGSAFSEQPQPDQDPFRAATGYHRIALRVMKALAGSQPERIVVNVLNRGAIADISPNEVVEVPCMLTRNSIVPEACGSLPEAVRGLVLAVKAYEAAAILAATTGSASAARKAMLLYPAVGEWQPATRLLEEMMRHDPLLANLKG